MAYQIKHALIEAQQTVSRLEARILLSHVLGVSHTYLIAHDDQALSAEMTAQFQALLTRASANEPIPYLTGEQPFYGRLFNVTPAVLIPRPETELLIEEAITFCQSRPKTKIIDVGTGSGCIAVTLAAELNNNQIEITASDISPEAIAIAQENSAHHQTDITFHVSHLLSQINGPFDLIAANLPYIAETERDVMDRSVLEYEPDLALFSSGEGLDLIEQLLHQAVTKINRPGLILLEMGWTQKERLIKIAQEIFPNAAVSCRQDYAGRDRLIKIELQ